jgi:hypothetical protein
MALDAKIVVSGSDVTATAPFPVRLPIDATLTGAAISMAQIDDGSVSGAPITRTIDVDPDFKLRSANENMQDSETFDYTAQNTNKHYMLATTMVPAFTTGGLVTNSTNITTNPSSVHFRTYAMFPVLGANTLYAEYEGSFSALPVSNTVITLSMVIPAAAAPFTIVDGAAFRLTSAGIVGVISYNGAETSTSVIDFTGIDGSAAYTPNKKYQFIIQITQREASFWIDGIPVGILKTPNGQGQPCMAASLALVVTHAIAGGTAGGALSFTLNSYSVSVGGGTYGDTLAVVGNRMYGSYAGLSGGTMGSLATYPNSANPTAAVPANTSLTANLLAMPGGQCWETATLAVTPVDGILMSYQVPMGTVSVQGRRMSVKGLYLSSTVQTLMAGGPLIKQYSLAWGHTAVSLATAEAATAKAPRRIALPPFQQVVTANQAAGTLVSQPGTFMDLGDAGIIVNPGEFIALVTKHVGTVMTAGVFAHQIQLVYGWI